MKKNGNISTLKAHMNVSVRDWNKIIRRDGTYRADHDLVVTPVAPQNKHLLAHGSRMVDPLVPRTPAFRCLTHTTCANDSTPRILANNNIARWLYHPRDESSSPPMFRIPAVQSPGVARSSGLEAGDAAPLASVGTKKLGSDPSLACTGASRQSRISLGTPITLCSVKTRSAV